MAVTIHPSAVVDPKAQLGTDVTVGPYAVIEDNVEIGDGTTVGSHAIVAHGTKTGSSCTIHSYAVVGSTPQDLKFDGEETTLEIGSNVIIREFCTLNRGTKAGIGPQLPVLATGGLAGKIDLPDEDLSSMILLTDERCQVSVRVRGTPEVGIVSGQRGEYGENPRLLLRHLSPDARIKEGMVVETTGRGGLC